MKRKIPWNLILIVLVIVGGAFAYWDLIEWFLTGLFVAFLLGLAAWILVSISNGW